MKCVQSVLLVACAAVAAAELVWQLTDSGGAARNPGNNVWSAAIAQMFSNGSLLLQVTNDSGGAAKFLCSEAVLFSPLVPAGSFSMTARFSTDANDSNSGLSFGVWRNDEQTMVVGVVFRMLPSKTTATVFINESEATSWTIADSAADLRNFRAEIALEDDGNGVREVYVALLDVNDGSVMNDYRSQTIDDDFEGLSPRFSFYLDEGSTPKQDFMAFISDINVNFSSTSTSTSTSSTKASSSTTSSSNFAATTSSNRSPLLSSSSSFGIGVRVTIHLTFFDMSSIDEDELVDEIAAILGINAELVLVESVDIGNSVVTVTISAPQAAAQQLEYLVQTTASELQESELLRHLLPDSARGGSFAQGHSSSVDDDEFSGVARLFPWKVVTAVGFFLVIF